MRKLFATVCTILLLAPATAFSFETGTFQQEASQKENVMGVDGAFTLDQGEVSLGYSLGFSDDPVQTVDADTGLIKKRNINYRLRSDYHLAVGVLEQLELGATMPLTIYQDGSNPYHTALSDLSFSGKLSLVDKSRSPIGAALTGDVSLPTGNGESLNSARGFTGGPGLVVGYSRGRAKLTANLSYTFRPAIKAQNYIQHNSFDYGFAGELPIGSTDFSAIASVAGKDNRANTILRHNPSSSDSPAEALAGVRFYPNDSLIVQAGGGPGISPGVGAPDYRLFASVHFRPQKREEPEPAKPKPSTKEEPPEKEEPPKDDKPKDDEDDSKEVSVTIDARVHFDTDKAVLKPSGEERLREAAEKIKEHEEITEIRIGGHTDSRASEEYNRRLSIRRAIAVETFLMKQGVDKKRLRLKGFGELRPIAPNDAPQKGMAENRRSELRITEVEGESVDPQKTITIEIKEEEK